MKRFFICLGVFALIMIVCDVAVGFVGSELVANAKGGDTKRGNYIGNYTDQKVLILGSSRALHHYDPDIFEETLGLTAYNCGFDGNGIICAYGYFQMIVVRYFPKVLVYEITPSSDLGLRDNHTYLGHLRYFYDQANVSSIFSDVDKTECFKMFSSMYRFNSMFPQLIMDNLHPLQNYTKGFQPLIGEMKFEPKPIDNRGTNEYDNLKLSYIERLINDCMGNTQLIFAVSPRYGNRDDSILEPIKTLSEKYGIPLLNHYTDDEFNSRKEYFRDSWHLNGYGATEYSKVIAQEIKDILEQI